jgi:hypothetical protein
MLKKVCTNAYLTFDHQLDRLGVDLPQENGKPTGPASNVTDSLIGGRMQRQIR